MPGTSRSLASSLLARSLAQASPEPQGTQDDKRNKAGQGAHPPEPRQGHPNRERGLSGAGLTFAGPGWLVGWGAVVQGSLFPPGPLGPVPEGADADQKGEDAHYCTDDDNRFGFPGLQAHQCPVRDDQAHAEGGAHYLGDQTADKSQ